jgi:UDP-N-acetylglucosamine 3-dehydrogenase
MNDKTSSTNTVRIGIVGLGKMGRRHARVFSATDQAEVAWTVDSAGHALDGVPSFPTISKALQAQADGVVVAAPTVAHGEIAQQVIEAGMPCLVEKPLSATAAEAARLVATATERHVQLATGHVERFNPAVIATRELLASGRAGRPISLSFRRVGLPPTFAPDVDVLSDLAVHDLDVCAFVLSLDESALIRVTGAIGWPANELFESALILVDAGGIGAQIQVNWRTPTRIREFSVTTDKCLIEVDYTTQLVEIVQRTEELELEDFAGFALHYGSVLRTRLEVPTAEPLAGQAFSFLAAVRGDPAPFLASGVDGLRAIRLVENARALTLERNL